MCLCAPRLDQGENGGPFFHLGIFLTREDVKNHLEFLQGMKEKFAAERKQLKEAVSQYAEEGTWIRPSLPEG